MTISIITINRNNRDGLRRTLESVSGQTEKPLEMIVIDGASTDGSVEVIPSFESVVTDWVSEPDRGIYHAMNKGIARAHGGWSLFLNSGDCLSGPEVIAQLTASKAVADIICGNALIQETPVRRKCPPKDISLDFLWSGTLCHQAALIRTDLLRKRPYDENLRIVADRKFFLQALVVDNCTFETVSVDVVNYDISGFSARNRLASELEWKHVLEEQIPSRIRSDYGTRKEGSLYGDGDYEKLFSEIGRRNWRKPVYHLVRGLLLLLSPFVKGARFIKEMPA